METITSLVLDFLILIAGIFGQYILRAIFSEEPPEPNIIETLSFWILIGVLFIGFFIMMLGNFLGITNF